MRYIVKGKVHRDRKQVRGIQGPGEGRVIVYMGAELLVEGNGKLWKQMEVMVA